MSGTSIIDNLAENTLLAGLQRMGGGGRQLRIATAFFSLNALLLLADTLEEFEHVQILFGDDADAQQRLKLLEMLRRESDKELREQRETVSQLSPLKKVEALFEAGRIEARCYTSKKFHAKAYLVHRPHVYPAHLGVIGSGNFTRPGLLQNIELNVELAPEQVGQLAAWYEERWDEAAADIVTEDVLAEIRRQITLYDPYVLYCKALALWGERQQGIPSHAQTALAGQLDPHQFYGFSQAVKIIEREQGVMVCDGVGLGKSFIALALMEHFCRLGKNVLLIAPKSVFETSWKGYLSRYLAPYIAPFGNVYPLLMTSLGFDPEEGDGENEGLRERRELIRQLARRADVLVIDESHNFRATAASRYRNLYSVIEPQGDKRKKTILLTATPINTEYRDLSAQMALITHEAGGIGGYRIDQIRRLTREMDKDARARKDVSQLQLSLGLGQPEKKDLYRDDLGRVLESVVIQRSRKTCKALSEATGRPLRFPHRCPPETINYQIGPESGEYRALVSLAQKRFQPGVALLQKMQQELRAAEEKGVPLKPVKVPSSLPRGIKLAAFLTEQYRRAPAEGVKTYRDEVHLAAPYPDVLALARRDGHQLPADAISGADWTLTNLASGDRLRRMAKAGMPLGEFIKGSVYRGITTGFNDAFVISAAERAELLAADPKNEALIKPYAMGREIRMWSLPETKHWMIFTQRGVDIDAFPTIRKHLAQWKDELQPKTSTSQKIGCKPGRYKWYEIQDEIAYADEFDKPKIVTTKAALRPAFALDESGLYLGNTSYFLPLSSMMQVNYVLGVLNSGVVWEYLKMVTVVLGDPDQRGRVEPRRDDIMKIPIPKASAADRAAIAALVQKCLDAKGVGCEAWEAEINGRVAALYGL